MKNYDPFEDLSEDMRAWRERQAKWRAILAQPPREWSEYTQEERNFIKAEQAGNSLERHNGV